MRKLLLYTVALMAVTGLLATQAFGFNYRGGHGGGHHSGGHHGGGHHAHHGSHHHSGHHVHHHVHHSVHHHGDRPFTHGWYGHHRGAWGWNNGAYGWGNPWAFATLGTAGAWLGLSALNNAGWENNETVYTADNGNVAEEQNADDDATDADADSDGQYADDAEDSAADQPAVAPSLTEAAALARIGADNTESGAQFLTLGVYTLAPAGQQDATAMVHLAVTKSGVLRGTFCDLKTDKDFNISGSVDKKTGRVAWTVGADGKEVFDTSIQDLTQQSGPLAIHDNDGHTSEWTIAHYKSLEKENEAPYDANPAKTKQEKTSRRPNSLFE
ncbi:MAG: hypothetical protein WD845_09135 [Pirellulales bacterium]